MNKIIKHIIILIIFSNQISFFGSKKEEEKMKSPTNFNTNFIGSNFYNPIKINCFVKNELKKINTNKDNYENNKYLYDQYFKKFIDDIQSLIGSEAKKDDIQSLIGSEAKKDDIQSLIGSEAKKSKAKRDYLKKFFSKKNERINEFEKLGFALQDNILKFFLEYTEVKQNRSDDYGTHFVFCDKRNNEKIIKMQRDDGKNNLFFEKYNFSSERFNFFNRLKNCIFPSADEFENSIRSSIPNGDDSLKDFLKYFENFYQLNKEIIEFNKNNNEDKLNRIFYRLQNKLFMTFEEELERIYENKRFYSEFSGILIKLNKEERMRFLKGIKDESDNNKKILFVKYMLNYISNYDKKNHFESNEELNEEFKLIIKENYLPNKEFIKNFLSKNPNFENLLFRNFPD